MDEFARYQRQMLLAGFGAAGQRRLRDSTVLVLGCGALGSILAETLARAGVGRLVIADRDIVELTNLQRQVLFDEADVAAAVPKAEAARKRIAEINSDVTVTAVVDDVNQGNIERIAGGADLLVDGLDNFETRYLANDYAVKHGLPYVYGAAIGTAGMAFAVLPHADEPTAWPADAAGPCLRCLFDEPPPAGTSPTCDTVGVLGTAAGMVAHYQATEALKILTGNYDRVSRSLLNIDVWTQQLLLLDVSSARDQADCRCCVQRRFDWLDGLHGTQTTILCGREAVQLRPGEGRHETDLQALATRLSGIGIVRKNDFLLQATVTDSGSRYELTVFANGRTIVKGTADTSVARSVVARFVGN